MNKVNPEMIVLAREVRGITQAELADALSLNRTTVTRYESGLIDVSPEHLRAIAGYLQRPESFFYWQERLYSASCLYHRRNRRISATELRLIHAQVNLIRVQAYRLLKRAQVRSKYSFYRLDPSKYGGPEGCARELRRLWQLPQGPVRNVVKAIESAGGMVFRCPFGMARVDGISQWALDDPEMPPVFFIHDQIPGDRGRLTAAHEIGHVVMHHLPTDGDPEDEANRFAAEFLMPADEIGGDLTNLTLPKAAALKPHWKVSMQGIIVHAHRLGEISDQKYAYLFKQISLKGYKKCEPVPIPPEEPEMFRELLSFHRRHLRVNLQELSESLGELEGNFQALYGHNLANFRLVV